MAKFCTKCGKPLAEGEVCNCAPATQQPVATVAAATTSTASQGNSLVSECIEIVKGMFTKPIDTLQANISDNKFMNALIMIIINGLAIGLFTVVLFKEVLGSLVSLLTGGLGSYAMLMGSSYAVEIPYFKYFMIATLVGIAMHFLLGAAAYLMADKVFKGNTSIKKMVTLFGFSSIILTAGLLVATICLFVSSTIALFVYMLASILYTYYIYKGIEFSCGTDKNKLGYVLVLTYGAVILVTYLITMIIG